MFVDFIYINSESMSFAEILLYTLVSAAIYLAFVVLAPLWVGILTGINARTKLWVIPLVPYLITTALGLLYRLVADSYPLEVFSQNFAVQVIFVFYAVASVAAFVTWIVAWVICSLDKNYYENAKRDTAEA